MNTGLSILEQPEFWIFGYGSLIWKPPPHFDRRVQGYIQGYVRRFWQASEDHRGTVERPGRVVTLIERSEWEKLGDPHFADDIVWGVAYRIKKPYVQQVKDYLDIREINGYSIHKVNVYSPGSDHCIINATVYIGTPENPQFVGKPPPDVQALSRRIYSCRGPSGENRDYLYQLHKALIELSPESNDNHISDLARLVALIESEEAKSDPKPMVHFDFSDTTI